MVWGTQHQICGPYYVSLRTGTIYVSVKIICVIFKRFLYRIAYEFYHASLLELPNRSNTGVFTLNRLLDGILVLDSSEVSVFGLRVARPTN